MNSQGTCISCSHCLGILDNLVIKISITGSTPSLSVHLYKNHESVSNVIRVYTTMTTPLCDKSLRTTTQWTFRQKFYIPPQSHWKYRLSGWPNCFVFGTSLARISAPRPAVLKYFVVFLSPSKQMLNSILKQGTTSRLPPTTIFLLYASWKRVK